MTGVVESDTAEVAEDVSGVATEHSSLRVAEANPTAAGVSEDNPAVNLKDTCYRIPCCRFYSIISYTLS